MRRWTLFGVVLGLAGCGGAPAPIPAPPPPPGGVVPATRGVERFGAPVAFGPPHPAAAAVVRRAREDARRLGKPPLRRDTALDAVAATLAPVGRPGTSFPPDLVRFAADHHGVVEPVLTYLVAVLPDVPPADIARQAAPVVESSLRRGRYDRIGAAVVDGTLVVLLTERRVRFDADVPRALPLNHDAPLEGRVLPPFGRAAVHVTLPGGAARTLAEGDRATFRTRLRCAEAGPHQVEVMGVDDEGPRVLANFTLYCGVAPPAAWAPAGAEGRTTEPAEAERVLLRLLRAERAAAGLPSVVWDDRLAAAARAHSADMRDHDFVAHVSPRTGDVSARVERARVPAAVVMENIGAADTAEAVHAGLMQSPAHRAAILDPEATRVGIGVVVADRAHTTRTLLATQVFVADPPPFVPAAAAATVRDAFAARVAAAGHPARHAPALDRVAASLAEDLARRRLDRDALSAAALERAVAAGVELDGVLVAVGQGQDPSPLAQSAGALPPTARRYGVGAAAADDLRLTVLLVGLSR
ncbi:MAG: CAP domain-containing protein [Myxococcales bacterium]|nr:CAP domain-containing protein [Myxococcales bacterium]